MAQRRGRRDTRILACKLAAQCLQGQVAAEGAVGARMMSLCVFFENYIDLGADATEADMKLISRRKVKKLRVLAGGRM